MLSSSSARRVLCRVGALEQLCSDALRAGLGVRLSLLARRSTQSKARPVGALSSLNY